MKLRKEKDRFGSVEIPSDKLWGASTERAFQMLNIGHEKMPIEMVYALAYIKRAAAEVNFSYKKISERKKRAITKAVDEILHSKFDDHFPLKVWQSGSGKETHMNINEVLHRIAEKQTGKTKVHAFDEISLSQSANDTFSSAMHIAVCIKVVHDLLPKLTLFHMALAGKMEEFKHIQKVGRAHLMESHRLTLGQEFAAFCAQIEKGILFLQQATMELYALPIGGTYIGMGQGAPKQYGEKVAKHLHKYTKIPFCVAPNRLSLIASHDPLVELSSAVKQLALMMNKMAGDISLMASGPEYGFGELELPMQGVSGKNDLSILEMVSQVCAQILGNDTTICFANSNGHFELNTFKPVIIYNLLQSIQLLGDGALSFANECIMDLKPNLSKLAKMAKNPLIVSSILNEELGTEKTARVFQLAKEKKLSIKEACVKLKFMNAKTFDRLTR